MHAKSLGADKFPFLLNLVALLLMFTPNTSIVELYKLRKFYQRPPHLSGVAVPFQAIPYSGISVLISK
jgi:hypothetical protein